ncbi:hypothetical protein M9H77_11574 [Catharanthus roseus]|uniref:Uncharacterized protein n=1 Tax=Catharanthus roseus TaxID=4058 RepID=A0ACC0BEW3_CATRO|nr:hypothetical protein M9H77_11574 [Catharanthus roseus]
MENYPNGEDENDLDNLAKTEGIEFQSSNVIYQYKNGASVIYDGLIFLNSQKDDNIVSKKRKYTDATQHETISKGSKDVNNHYGSPQQTICSNFRVQILEILRKPYDKEEHERLMQEITKRKPQHKHRDLRSGGVKFYPSDKMGKSLLDHHLVSHEEKKRERNRERGLPVTSVTAEAISEGIIPDHPLAYLRRLNVALPLLGDHLHFW